jgi:very-short-patch-repair endonuclease
MKNEIGIIVKASINPVTVNDIRLKLKFDSIKVNSYQIIHELRKLRHDGVVQLIRGKWSSKMHSAKKTENHFPNFDKITRNRIELPTIVHLRDNNNGRYSERRIDSIEVAHTSIRHEIKPKKENFAGPWGTFRKLLGYYTDCIRNDEGHEASAYAEDFGKRFVFANKIGHWYPQADSVWKSYFPANDSSSGFFKNLINMGQDAVLILGYPLHIFSKADQKTDSPVFLKPIFTYQLKFELTSSGINVLCDFPEPEINLDWLSYSFKGSDKQRMFLSACGLLGRGKQDESFEQANTGRTTADFDSLAAGVSTYLGEHIREPLFPGNLSNTNLQTHPKSGIYNRAVLMIGNRTRYARSLLKDLSNIEKFSDEHLDQTALRFVFKSKELGCTKENETNQQIPLEVFPLNEQQRKSVGWILSDNISVITGPPGTGKSQVVAAAMANYRFHELPAVFTSRNHKALDTVVERLNSFDFGPLISRANSKEDPFLKFGFEQAIRQLLLEEYSELSKDHWVQLKKKVKTLLEHREEKVQVAYIIQGLSDQLGELEQIASLISEQLDNSLIVELNESADMFPKVELVQLDQKVGKYRTGELSNTFINKIKVYIQYLLLNPKIISIQSKLSRHFPQLKLHFVKSGFQAMLEFSNRLPHFLLLAEYCENRVQANAVEDKLKKLPELTHLIQAIGKLTKNIQEIVPSIFESNKKRWTGLPHTTNREELASLKSALNGIWKFGFGEAVDNEIRDSIKKYLPLLMKHFPLWAVTNLSVGSRIPLIPGCFEYAVIDEASQCDIASAIPILFRAKRAGVVGDPHQLTHVTKLSKDRELLLRKRHNLLNLEEQRFTYADNSLFDLIAQTNGVRTVLLKDTYRSYDSIADYSNQFFYGGNLRVATDKSKLKFPKNSTPGIHWTDVSSEIKREGPSGCISIEEVDTVLRIVKHILLENSFEGTLGITTPFRQQANRLNDALTQEIPAAYRQSSNLIADTAHGFQGDERDVIILSLCVGPDMPNGSKNFIRVNPNLLNVAVSRARAVLHVVGNKAWVSSCGIPHLEHLAIEKKPIHSSPQESPWFPFESPWEKKLFTALETAGIKPEIQFPVRGRRLDLALVRNGKHSLKLDIEVDGDRYHRNPDGSRKRDDVWRDIQLQGMGWHVMRFWVYQLREDMQACVNKVMKVWYEHE